MLIEKKRTKKCWPIFYKMKINYMKRNLKNDANKKLNEQFIIKWTKQLSRKRKEFEASNY